MNRSGETFADVSGERSRWYWGEGRPLVRIEGAVAVAVEPGGSQRILDADGVSHWVAPGYDRLEVVDGDGRSSSLPFAPGPVPPRTGVAPIDAASEAWREYVLADGATVRIEDPLVVEVRDDGSHRVSRVGADPAVVDGGIVALRWQARHRAPHFVR